MTQPMTGREISLVIKATGIGPNQWVDANGETPFDVAVALFWILERRSNADLTFDAVMDRSFTELGEQIAAADLSGLVGDDNPKADS